ncbi:MAG: hypothetical protein ACPGLV_13625, partial [Bacteroidia bacterium]
FTICPNPALSNTIYLSQVDDYTLSSTSGELLSTYKNVGHIDISKLSPGSYIISNSSGNSTLLLRN